MNESISKNMLHVFFSLVIPSGLTYFFWLLVANISGTEIIGTIAAVASFSTILTIVSSLDMHIGMRRFLGISKEKNNWLEFKQLVTSVLSFSSLTTIITLLVILNPIFNVLDYLSIDEKFIPIIIIFVISNVIINILTGTFISALKSKNMIIPNVISSSSRFILLISLMYSNNLSDVNLTWTYTLAFIVLGIIFLGIVIRFFSNISGNSFLHMKTYIKQIINPSLVTWIPHLIGLLGTQLSIVATFSIKGASESGMFYIAFAIVNIVNMIPSAIHLINYPVMSGMKKINDQEKLLQDSLKIAFLITMPIASIVLFYGEEILSIFGKEFLLSYSTLAILVIGLPLSIIADGCFWLIFARGNYKNVLFLGLSANVSRILLYVLLVPIYGGFGAAIGYVVGYFLHMIFTIMLLQKLKIKLPYMKFLIISLIPFLLSFGIQKLDLNIFGIILIILTTITIYLKAKLLDENDIGMILNSMNKKGSTKTIVKKLKQFRIM